jgi:hypothetical protein
MAKRVQCDPLLDAYFPHRCLQRSTNHVDMHGPPVSAWEQVSTSWPRLNPVEPKLRQQFRAEKHKAVFPILGAANVYHHALAIDVPDLQPQRLGNPQASGVGCSQNGPQFQ